MKGGALRRAGHTWAAKGMASKAKKKIAVMCAQTSTLMVEIDPVFWRPCSCHHHI